MTFPPRPVAPEPRRFASFDGRTVAYHDLGSGRATVLIHGIMSSAAWAWLGPGHAAKLVASGRRAIVPDLRGHAASDAPHDSSAYENDALARDILALVRHLGLDEFDLVGYSLGARTAIRCLVIGAKPGRVVLGGATDAMVGSRGMMADRFDRLIASGGKTGDPEEEQTWAWLTYGGFDPHAMRALSHAQVPTTHADLAAIDTPALVIIGKQDTMAGSAERLASLLEHATFRSIRGDHVQAGLSAAFGDAIVEFLEAGRGEALTPAGPQRTVSLRETPPREARRPAPGDGR